MNLLGMFDILTQQEIAKGKPLGARPGLGTQPHYEAPGDLPVEYVKRSDQHRVSEAVPSIMARSWPWGSQIAVKKKNITINHC